MEALNWTRQELSPALFSMRKLSRIFTTSTEHCYVEGCTIYQEHPKDISLKFLVSDSTGSLRTVFLKGVQDETLNFVASPNTPKKVKVLWENGDMVINHEMLKNELYELLTSLGNLSIPIEELTWNTLTSVGATLRLKNVKLNKHTNEYVLIFD